MPVLYTDPSALQHRRYLTGAHVSYVQASPAWTCLPASLPSVTTPSHSRARAAWLLLGTDCTAVLLLVKSTEDSRFRALKTENWGDPQHRVACTSDTESKTVGRLIKKLETVHNTRNVGVHCFRRCFFFWICGEQWIKERCRMETFRIPSASLKSFYSSFVCVTGGRS